MSSTNRKVKKYEQEALHSLESLFCEYVIECSKDMNNRKLLFNQYNHLWHLKCKSIRNKSNGLVTITTEKFAEMDKKHFDTFYKELKPKQSIWQTIKNKLKFK